MYFRLTRCQKPGIRAMLYIKKLKLLIKTIKIRLETIDILLEDANDFNITRRLLIEKTTLLEDKEYCESLLRQLIFLKKSQRSTVNGQWSTVKTNGR